MLEACENRNTAERRIVSSIRQTSISQIVDGQAPSDGRTNVGRCQLPLPRFSTCRPVEKRFRETYISLANKYMSLETLPIRIINIMRLTKFVYLPLLVLLAYYLVSN